MSLKEKLFTDLKEAMKNKDVVLKDTIQMVRASILQIEKDQKIELENDDVIDVIVKEIKKCNDVLPDFEKSGRQDLIDELNRKLTILKSYLPEQLSIDEINNIVLCAVQETNASSMKDMSKVMALVSQRTKGRTDNKTISEVVKKVLSTT